LLKVEEKTTSENFHLNRGLLHFLDLKGVDHPYGKYSSYF
jgi:hypothetical protein